MKEHSAVSNLRHKKRRISLRLKRSAPDGEAFGILERLERFEPEGAVTVRKALELGTKFLGQAGIESARLDAELLLGKVLEMRREAIYLNYEMALEAVERARFQRLLGRRALREPIAYITETREFWSLEFFITPDVLVPRPETELLVEKALGLIRAEPQMADGKLKILDLGTGSGVIAVSLAGELPQVEIWATDVSSAAMKVADANARRHGVRQKIHLLQGKLFEPFAGAHAGGEAFHMIVSNPPYVRRNDIRELPPEVRDWEPRSALDGGWDGLDFYRRIIQEGRLYLVDGGFMALEIGAEMSRGVSGLFRSSGCYSKASLYLDYAGRDRVVVAQKLAAPASRLQPRASSLPEGFRG